VEARGGPRATIELPTMSMRKSRRRQIIISKLQPPKEVEDSPIKPHLEMHHSSSKMRNRTE
jgi:hypothetical protein